MDSLDGLFNTIFEWLSGNKLALNEDKYQRILFSLSKNVVKGDLVKLLGFTLDSGLGWDGHIVALCVKLSRVIYLLRKLMCEIPFTFARLVLLPFFQSHVVYGIRLWIHSPQAQRILLLQKRLSI